MGCSGEFSSRVDRYILATFVAMKWVFAIGFLSLVMAGITSCEEEKEVTETKITLVLPLVEAVFPNC